MIEHCGSSRLVNANGPSKFVARVVSNPSTVSVRRVGQRARVVDQDVDLTVDQAGEGPHRRQVGKIELDHRLVEPPISAARCFPSSVLRTAMITCAPAPARIRAVPRPTPLVAPVTMTRLPMKSPSRLGVQGIVTAISLNYRL